MSFILHRYDFTSQRTIGVLFGHDFSCHTLEDVVRPVGAAKVPGRTAIPSGTYSLIVAYSPRFGRPMPTICDVPGFSGIRIHAGNTEHDTEGCPLVGDYRSVDAIHLSKSALGRLLAILTTQRAFLLEIRP